MRLIVMTLCGMLLCSLFVGCGDRTDLYSCYRSLPREGWKFGKAVEFVPVHADSICRGAFVVAISHGNDYPYTALRLEVARTVAGGEMLRDTVDISVADRYGQWLGRGIGTLFQLTDTLPPVVHRSGEPVYVRHLMKADTLCGINQVGLFFVSVR